MLISSFFFIITTTVVFFSFFIIITIIITTRHDIRERFVAGRYSSIDFQEVFEIFHGRHPRHTGLSSTRDVFSETRVDRSDVRHPSSFGLDVDRVPPHGLLMTRTKEKQDFFFRHEGTCALVFGTHTTGNRSGNLDGRQQADLGFSMIVRGI